MTDVINNTEPTVLDILTSARAILTEPTSWTQGVYARDENGESIEPYEDEATCFCLWGALKAAASRFPTSVHWGAQLAVYNSIEIGDIPSFNDAAGTTHADVLNVLDAAIARKSA
jgi:hypothetical protein